MIQQLREHVDRGNCPLPADLVAIADEVINNQNDITDVKEDWSCLSLHHAACCDHCKRVNCFSLEEGSELAFDFYETFTDNISGKKCKLGHLVTHCSRANATKVHLCSECHLYLWKRKNWRNKESSFRCVGLAFVTIY